MGTIDEVAVYFRQMARMMPAAATVLVLLLASARPVAAALEITLSVSPTEARIGESVEVLVRTFLPVGQDEIGLPMPSVAYPVASGVWNVLYPVDYPFDVVATAADGATIAIPLARDPTDSTLWRGTFQPSASGAWTVVVRNFGADHPGASAVVRVPGEGAGDAKWAVGAAMATGLVVAFLGGLAVGRSRFRSRSPTP